MKFSKNWLLVFSAIIGLSTTSGALASSSVPKSLRGYYIGSHKLLILSKKMVTGGAPQSDTYGNTVTHVYKSKGYYYIRSYIKMDKTYWGTLKLKKVGYRKISCKDGFYKGAILHKVTKKQYFHYAYYG